jgi:(p)ppGpp synthase/HD superfamily hydrolase
MMLIKKAMEFAIESHKGQVRRYTNAPYWSHLAEVNGILTVLQPTQEYVATAWLHDVVEDCGVHVEELAVKFGYDIAENVRLLSDTEEGNRATRKKFQRERLSLVSGGVQTVKYADIISNAIGIKTFDPKFWLVYRDECEALLNVMEKGNKYLRDMAFNSLK